MATEGKERNIYILTLCIMSILLIYPFFIPRPTEYSFTGSVILEISTVVFSFLYAIAIYVLFWFRKLRLTSIEKFLFLFLGWQLLSIIWTPDKLYALFHWIKLFSFLFLLVLVASYINEEHHLFEALRAYYYSFAIGLLKVFVDIYIFGKGQYFGGRLGYGWISPVWLGILSSYGLVFSIILPKKNNFQKIVSFFVILLSIFLLLNSGGRAGIFVSIVILMYWFLKLSFCNLLIIIWCSLPFLILLFWYYTFGLNINLDQLLMYPPIQANYLFFSNVDNILSLSGRMLLWKAVINLLKNDFLKCIIGYGFAAHRRIRIDVFGFWIAGEPHNALLAIFFDNGVIGLFIFLSILFLFLKVAITYKQKEVTYWSIMTIFVVSISYGVVQSTYGSTLRIESGIFYFIIIIGYRWFLKHNKILNKQK